MLLTARPDGSPLVKVLDFGIVRLPAGASTTGSAAGAVPRPEPAAPASPYLAPEQRRSADDVDPRTDIWAVGAVLHECLTGQRPFAESSASGQIAAGAAPRPMDPRVPAGLQAIVVRCLQADRDARFPSIAALAAELAPYAHDHRTAGFLVERANRLAQGVIDPVEPMPVPALSPATAPPRRAPGASRAWSRRRYATIAAVALGVSIAGISVAAMIRTGRSPGVSPAIAAKPIVANPGAGDGPSPGSLAAPGPGAADPTPPAAAATRPLP